MSTAAPTSKEMRQFARIPFVRVQRLCDSFDFGPPDIAKFYTVQCRDISRNGISFVLPYCPRFRYAVIELGEADNPTYWVIIVVRTDQLDDGQYIVGCRFVRRVKLEPEVKSRNSGG